MLNFDQYVALYGEHVVQAIVERLERYEGVRSNMGAPLEDRWNMLMQENKKFAVQELHQESARIFS